MRQMADNVQEERQELMRNEETRLQTRPNVMEAGKTFFLFSILEVSILHYLQKRVAAADVTEVGDEKQTRNFLQSEKRTAFDCDPRNYRKG